MHQHVQREGIGMELQQVLEGEHVRGGDVAWGRGWGWSFDLHRGFVVVAVVCWLVVEGLVC